MLKTPEPDYFFFPLLQLQVWPLVTVEARTYPKMLNSEVNKNVVDWSPAMVFSCIYSKAMALCRAMVCTSGTHGRINVKLTHRTAGSYCLLKRLTFICKPFPFLDQKTLLTVGLDSK